MDRNKRFVLGFFACFLLFLALAAGTVFVLDPFFHYHAPWTDLPPVSANERYQVGGIAEHFDYDSLVVGTSVTANFRASWFDELLGGKTYAEGEQSVYVDYVKVTPDNASEFIK